MRKDDYDYLFALSAVEQKLKEIDKEYPKIGGFIVVDVCPNCGKINIEICKHSSCYNNQCKCGYLTGFIGRNHAN